MSSINAIGSGLNYDSDGTTTLILKTGSINAVTIDGSQTVTINASTASTTPTTGALVVTGGLGVSGDINVAGNVALKGNLTLGDGVGTDFITFNAQMLSGTQLKTSQSNGNTLAISAYDLNDAVYRDLITLTASNTPTLAISSTGVGSIDNITIGGITPAAGTFTTLGATSSLSVTSSNAIVTLSPIDTGTVTINPATAGNINNMAIGVSTPAAGTFTTLGATSSLSITGADVLITLSPTGTGSVTINPATAGTINNMAIGGSVASTGTFTSLTTNGSTNTPAIITPTTSLSSVAWTTSGINLRVQARTYTDTNSGPGTIAASYIHALAAPTFSSTNSVTITEAANLYVAAPLAGTNSILTGNGFSIVADGRIKASDFTGSIGSTTASSGAFTTLSASSTVSGVGFSTYLASPPAIGGTLAAAGSFTTLSASSTVSGTGFSTYLASPPAIGGTLAAAGSFTTLSASSTVSGTGFSTYLASPPAIGGTLAAAGSFTTLSASSTVSGTGFSTYLASPPSIGGTLAAAGAFTTLTASTSILSNGTGGIGYSTGAGGTGSQSTAKTNSVTINNPTGQITMSNTALGAATIVSFTLTNNTIAATDLVVVQHVSVGTIGAYTCTATANAGSATVFVRNNSAASLSEAIVLRFAVIKSVNA